MSFIASQVKGHCYPTCLNFVTRCVDKRRSSFPAKSAQLVELNTGCVYKIQEYRMCIKSLKFSSKQILISRNILSFQIKFLGRKLMTSLNNYIQPEEDVRQLSKAICRIVSHIILDPLNCLPIRFTVDLTQYVGQHFFIPCFKFHKLLEDGHLSRTKLSRYKGMHVFHRDVQKIPFLVQCCSDWLRLTQ